MSVSNLVLQLQIITSAVWLGPMCVTQLRTSPLINNTLNAVKLIELKVGLCVDLSC